MNSGRMREATLGVDIGTTGCRSVVYSELAEVVASSQRFYATNAPKPGWAEQNAEYVIEQIEDSIQEAVAKARTAGYEVTLLGFSAVNHGLIPIKNGLPLRPCIIWADNRSAEITEIWKKQGLKEEFYFRTCCPLHPMYLPGKLTWLAQFEPHIFSETEKFISIKELLFYRWFEQYVIDSSIASSSGLYNVHQRKWDEEILQQVGVREEQLAEIVSTLAVFEGLKEKVRLKLGLNPDVKIVIGAGDGVLSSLGAGAIAPGEVTVMIGTSGAARITVDKPTLDRDGRTWCYQLLPEAWVVGGAINNAGLTLEWVRQNWLNGVSFAEIERLASVTPAGAEGLQLLPFLTGERSPNWNPHIRAALVGLDLAHGSGHFVRAAMEGVAYRIRSVYEPIAEIAGQVNSIRIGGGFTASPTWVQILADVLNKPLQLLGEPQGSAYGAVVLAWHAVGKKPLAESVKMTKVEQVIYPREEQANLYSQEYIRYLDHYRNFFSKL